VSTGQCWYSIQLKNTESWPCTWQPTQTVHTNKHVNNGLSLSVMASEINSTERGERLPNIGKKIIFFTGSLRWASSKKNNKQTNKQKQTTKQNENKKKPRKIWWKIKRFDFLNLAIFRPVKKMIFLPMEKGSRSWLGVL
jgi:hypothetical protein